MRSNERLTATKRLALRAEAVQRGANPDQHAACELFRHHLERLADSDSGDDEPAAKKARA